MGAMTKYAQSGPSDKYSRYAWVMQAMFDEVIDELADTDPQHIAGWFDQFGRIIAWCGSGDENDLPENVRPYILQRLALTAGESSD
jgi:hypothetical protein